MKLLIDQAIVDLKLVKSKLHLTCSDCQALIKESMKTRCTAFQSLTPGMLHNVGSIMWSTNIVVEYYCSTV